METTGSVVRLRAVSWVTSPAVESLEESHLAQMRWIARESNKDARSPACIVWGASETHLVCLHDATGPAFDLWLNGILEGMIFHAGTDEPAGWVGQGGVSQGGVECDDDALRVALCEALTWERLDELRGAPAAEPVGDAKSI